MRPSGVSTVIDAGCAYWSVAWSYAYRKPAALGERLDRRLAPRQEVDVARVGRADVPAHEVLLALGGHRRRFARVEAHDHDLVLLADRERDALQRSGESVQHLRAQHRAAVIDERQHDRPRPEELAELHGRALLVAEFARRAASSRRASGRCRFPSGAGPARRPRCRRPAGSSAQPPATRRRTAAAPARRGCTPGLEARPARRAEAPPHSGVMTAGHGRLPLPVAGAGEATGPRTGNPRSSIRSFARSMGMR